MEIVIIGCGIIGAAIAYELSLIPDLQITVIDQSSADQIPSGATSAALGVNIGIINKKLKGLAWKLRKITVERYLTLIPELEKNIGQKIHFNQQGILLLVSQDDDLTPWQNLVEMREKQGYKLELWSLDKIKSECPQINLKNWPNAIYSPTDIQINPTVLTLALIQGAKNNGVKFQFDVNATNLMTTNTGICQAINTNIGVINTDYLIIAAGLGSTELTRSLPQPVNLEPVLGQCLEIELEKPLGNSNFQPAITGEDVHIVPRENNKYWIGATLEFPNEKKEVIAQKQFLEEVLKKAEKMCPELGQGKIIKTWSGLRPRPINRPAPIIEKMTGYSNILLATGHYRNGILLAPVTALKIKEMIL